MTVEQLKVMREANPFRPFRIHLAGGKTFDIPHRDFVAPAPSGRKAIVYQADDTYSVVDVYLITELEILGPPAPNNGPVAAK
jgi:hypothetical protein